MTESYDGGEYARTVFAGLTPSAPATEHAEEAHRAGLRAGMMATMPLVLAGAMTVTVGVATSTPANAAPKRPQLPQAPAQPALRAAATTTTSPSTVPATYTVKAGDTVSGIAGRYGLSTASVLTLNGLSWKSLIFPGQVLKLTAAGKPQSAPAPTTPATSDIRRYTIVKGDTISGIAARFGVATDVVLKANGLGWSSIIYPGQSIVIPQPGASAPSTPAPSAPAPSNPAPANPAPSAPATSTTYKIVSGDTVTGIAKRFGVTIQSILDANGLTLSSTIYAGRTLTIPAAGAPSTPPASSTPPAQNPPAQDPLDADEVSNVTPVGSTTYVIKSGDTLTAIAKRFGVTIQSLLDANGLTLSSTIYAGRTLTIPGVSTPGGVAVTPLDAEQTANARVIIQVGRELGVPDRGLVIALATAAQESSLRNLPYGDRDSIGLFQQRPSAGWGSTDQLLDTRYAARLFFGGPSNPNKGITRGLLDIPGWQSLTLTQAAQAVQISAFPDAYAKWETSATAWLAQLG